MWQLLIVLYFIFGTASYLLRRVLAQKFGEHNRLMVAVFFVFFLLPTIAVLSIFLPHNLYISLGNLALLLLGSVVWPVFNIAAFQANKEVDAGTFTIINNLSPLVTLAVAIPLLNESLNLVQIAGVGLLIFSGILAAGTQLKKSGEIGTKGLLMCLLATAILGLAIAYERFMLTRVDLGTYIIYGWGAQIIWSVILAYKEMKNLPQLFSKALGARPTLISWGLVSVLRSVTFISALKLSTASIISSASNFLSIAIVITAYFYLKERENMIYKMAAVIIGVAGLILIAK